MQIQRRNWKQTDDETRGGRKKLIKYMPVPSSTKPSVSRIDRGRRFKLLLGGSSAHATNPSLLHPPPLCSSVYVSMSRGASVISMRHFNFVGAPRRGLLKFQDATRVCSFEHTTFILAPRRGFFMGLLKQHELPQTTQPDRGVILRGRIS